MLCGCGHAISFPTILYIVLYGFNYELYINQDRHILHPSTIVIIIYYRPKYCVSYAVYMGQSVVCVVVIFFIISYCSWVVGICEQHSQLILANDAQQQQRQKHNISDVLARTGKSTAQHSTCMVIESNRIESNQIMHCYE